MNDIYLEHIRERVLCITWHAYLSDVAMSWIKA